MKISLLNSASALIFFCLLNAAAPVRAEEAPAKFVVTAEEQAVVDHTNDERKKAGLPELKLNPLLAEIARKHAENMARQNEMNHTLDGKKHTQRLDAAGYKWMAARENLAFNQRSAEEVLGDWMKSEHHKENILARDISEIGVGIASDAQGQRYYVQVFARPEK